MLVSVCLSPTCIPNCGVFDCILKEPEEVQKAALPPSTPAQKPAAPQKGTQPAAAPPAASGHVVGNHLLSVPAH